MRKLNSKQRKSIKAGSLTGALFSGIGSIVKAVFGGVVDLVNSICGWTMAFKESNKQHAKVNFKMGNAAINYDDTNIVRANEQLALEKIKAAKMNTTSVKNTKLALQPLPDVTDLSHEHSTSSHSVDNIESTLDSTNLFDDFMHF